MISKFRRAFGGANASESLRAWKWKTHDLVNDCCKCTHVVLDFSLLSYTLCVKPSFSCMNKDISSTREIISFIYLFIFLLHIKPRSNVWINFKTTSHLQKIVKHSERAANESLFLSIKFNDASHQIYCIFFWNAEFYAHIISTKIHCQCHGIRSNDTYNTIKTLISTNCAKESNLFKLIISVSRSLTDEQ